MPCGRDQQAHRPEMATREDDQAPQRECRALCRGDQLARPPHLAPLPLRGRTARNRGPPPQGHSGRAIAAALGRSPSTISRELRRNASPLTGHYRPFEAQKLTVARRGRPGRGRLLRDSELRSCVEESLACRWSPAQVSVQLRQRFPGQRDRHLAAESIYQAIYRPELGGLARSIPQSLRTGRRIRPTRRCWPSTESGRRSHDAAGRGRRQPRAYALRSGVCCPLRREPGPGVLGARSSVTG